MSPTYRCAAAIAIAFALSACTIARIPVDNLTYQGTTTIKSRKTASVTVRSSGIGSRAHTTMMPVGGIQIPTTQKNAGEAFDAQGQQEFEQSLKKEFVRLGMFSSATSEASAADIGVVVNINYSTFNSDFVEYTWNLTMTLTGGKAPLQKSYEVSSLEGDTLWQKIDTNGAQARVKLAQKTLDKMVPDIEAYVREAVR